MRGTFSNYASSTLANPCGPSDASFTLVGGGGIPFPTVSAFSPDPFVVSIDQELILCSGRSGDIFAVKTRGWENTSAASHSAGARVTCAPTAGMISRVWSVLPDVANPDVPPWARGGSVPSSYDDEFEQAQNGGATAGNWTFSPNDGGQIHSWGYNYRSLFDFHRSNSTGTLYYLYQAFAPAGAFTVTAKMAHAGSFSLANEYQLSLFVADGSNPASSADGGYRARVDWLVGPSVPGVTTEPFAGSPVVYSQPRVSAFRGSYDLNGTWAAMSTAWGGLSIAPRQGQTYLSLSYDGSAVWNAWVGDGLAYQHLGSISNPFIPASMGFRFAIDHAPTGPAYHHAFIDWVRVSSADRATYNALLPQ